MANEPLFNGIGAHLARWVDVVYYNPELSQSLSSSVLESSQITEDDGFLTIPQGVTITGSLTVDGTINASSIMGPSQTGSLVGDASLLTGYPSNLIRLSGISGNTFSSSRFYFPHNVNVQGTMTVTEVHTEYDSGSIIYASGSTKFGNSADDTHIFTGSAFVDGDVLSNGLVAVGALSGDGSQITDFTQLSLPDTVVYIDQSNTFTRNQSINGALSASNNLILNKLQVAESSYFEINRTGLTAGTSSIHIVSQSDARCYFMDFIISSGSSARLAASITETWNNGQMDFTETCTPDIGNVSSHIDYNCTLDETFANLTICINSGIWNIKGIVRTI